MMTEHQDEIRYLVEEVGLSEEEARLRLQDRDLWLLDADQRFDGELQGVEGVRMWEQAVTVSRAIADIVSNGPDSIQAKPAITTLVWDAAKRAEEALHRARRRTGNPEMRNTVFGQVLAEFLERRGLPVTPFHVGKLAEEAGLDGWAVINRMADMMSVDAGYLNGLADALELSQAEKDELALAYSMERRV